MKTIGKWFLAIRPNTLLISAIPVIVAVVLSYSRNTGEFSWLDCVLVLLCAMSLQSLANLINDYYDFKTGVDKEGRLGPKRMMTDGSIGIGGMRKAIFVNLAFSLLTGVYMVIVGGLPILIVGVLSIVFAWLYTATPYSLSYLGIADCFAFAFYGPIACAGAGYILCKEFSWVFVTSGCVCGCISAMVLTVNNIRDRQTDKSHGKKTLVVRFGKLVGETEYLVLASLTLLFSYLAFGLSLACLIVLFALGLYVLLRKTDGKKYNDVLKLTVMLNVVYLVLIVTDFLL